MTNTPEQDRAINLNGNLIVSASAGTGKTTVLSARVCRLVGEGMRVDRMLILTFTRAAASEMKTRIGDRLLEAAAAETGTRAAYFREQAEAVSNASISTIDSFCSKIVFRHYFRVGLTPSCKTLDPAESEILSDKAMSDTLDRFAEEQAELYRTLIIAFGDEDGLIKAIRQMRSRLDAQPDPGAWLSECEADLTRPEALKEQLLYQLKNDQTELELYTEDLDHEASLLSPDCGKVLSTVSLLVSHARGAMLAADREAYANALSGILDAKGSLRWPDGYTDDDKAGVADAKKAFLAVVREQYARCSVPFDELLKNEQDAVPVLSAFYTILHAYLDAFAAEKRAQNAIDFVDLEHMAIEILKDDEIAAEYRERFLTIIVDEYQDSNRVQEAILNRIARPGSLFFVGDVKQSIYRFRMAEPSLFLEKCETFCGSAGTRVDLGYNFRSGKAVIDTVNTTFSAIMRKSIAEIDYDARAMLKQGERKGDPLPEGKAELHLFSAEQDPNDEEDLSTAEAEARFAARTILERMQQPMFDGKQWRPCRFGDFAVLLRGNTHMQVWAQTLAAEGIRCFAASAGGTFDAIEVRLVISLLEVLDNRRQDIPLLAVLRSPLFDFTDEELILLRADKPRMPLLDCLLRSRETNAHADAFLTQVETWQALARRRSPGDFLETVLDETHLRERVAVLNGGAQRAANLDALVAKARSYEAAGQSGIHGFLLYLENAKKAKAKDAESSMTADVVRIMTIHSSKGLEFPFVVIGMLNTKYSNKDLEPALITDAKLGVGLTYKDRFGVKHETAARATVAAAIQRACWAEEQRVLYVAMTRAKQELYLLGTVRNVEKVKNSLRDPTLLRLQNCKTPMSLLMLVQNGRLPMPVHYKSEFSGARTAPRLEALRQPTQAELDLLKARFSQQTHATAAAIPEKTSVTALERAEMPTFDEPAFETGYDVLLAGSAVHRVLECMPLKDAARRAAFFDAQPDLSAYHRSSIERFTRSPLFARMAAAGRVEREWNFVCPFPARELTGADSDEPVLLQGVIDACFLEDGAWVLLDYKTDRVEGDPAVHAQKHARQTSLYGKVLERLTGKPVKERYIVLLSVGAEVPV